MTGILLAGLISILSASANPGQPGPNHILSTLWNPAHTWNQWPNELSPDQCRRLSDSLKREFVNPDLGAQSFDIHFLTVKRESETLAILETEAGIGFCTRVYRIQSGKTTLLQMFDGYVWGIEKDSATDMPRFDICRIPGGDRVQYCVTEYSPQLSQGRLRFISMRHFASHMDTKLSERELSEHAFTVTVSTQQAYLRKKPEIDSTGFTPEALAPSNIFAVFGFGSQGIVLDSTIDQAGRAWFLLLMDPPAIRSQAYEADDSSATMLVGWMSSNILKRKP